MRLRQEMTTPPDDTNGDVEIIGGHNARVTEDEGTTLYNADWRGAVNAPKETAELSGKKAEIIGPGGIARAIGHGREQQDIEVRSQQGQKKEQNYCFKT